MAPHLILAATLSPERTLDVTYISHCVIIDIVICHLICGHTQAEHQLLQLQVSMALGSQRTWQGTKLMAADPERTHLRVGAVQATIDMLHIVLIMPVRICACYGRPACNFTVDRHAGGAHSCFAALRCMCGWRMQRTHLVQHTCLAAGIYALRYVQRTMYHTHTTQTTNHISSTTHTHARTLPYLTQAHALQPSGSCEHEVQTTVR